MDGRLGQWEPAPNAWAEWLARKHVERDLGGPKEPVNPLIRAMSEAQGRTEAQEVALANPENVLRAQANEKRRAIEMRLRQAQGFPALVAFLRRSLAKLPRPAQSARHRTAPVYVAAHWTDAA